MILSHMVSSSLNVSLYETILTHFLKKHVWFLALDLGPNPRQDEVLDQFQM